MQETLNMDTFHTVRKYEVLLHMNLEIPASLNKFIIETKAWIPTVCPCPVHYAELPKNKSSTIFQ